MTEGGLQQQLLKREILYSVAFAARMAARALVALGASEPPPPGWKPNDRERHLLAVIRAVATTFLGAVGPGGARASSLLPSRNADAAPATANIGAASYAAAAAATLAANAAFAVSDLAFASVAKAAANAAYAAAAAPNSAANAAATAAAGSAYTAVDAVTVARTAVTRERWALLVKDELSARFAADLLRRPLWSPCPPEALAEKRRLVSLLREVGGFQFWANWYEHIFEGQLDLGLLERAAMVPSEIQSQGPAAVNAYLLSQSEATTPLNRVRVIFIGHGGAGKTSLVRALHGEAVAPQEPMTAGIEIRSWPVPNSPIKADFWDFGGQVMAHATHQLFLRERCLYVVVLDGRPEINANEQAQYWLEHVRAFGGPAPALIVGNKCDQIAVNIDERFLKEKYGIAGFYPLSCTEREARRKPEWDRFVRDFGEQLAAVGTHQLRLTPRHFGVLKTLELRSRQQTFIEEREFCELCAAHDIADQGDLDRNWLRDLLDKLGIIVSFPKLPFLSAHLLNPRWLTYGIYALFYSEQSRRNLGRLSDAEICSLLGVGGVRDNVGNALAYTPERCQFIRTAMEQFRLCYPLPGGAIIIPALLDPNQPELDFDKQTARCFEIDFEGFVPRHALAELIARRHAEIADGKVWQNGLKLRSQAYRAEALAQVDYGARRLSIWVSGPDGGDLLSILYADVGEILARMPDLVWTPYVVLPESERLTPMQLPPAPGGALPRARYRDLLALRARGDTVYVCAEGEFSVAGALRILPDEAPLASRSSRSQQPRSGVKTRETEQAAARVVEIFLASSEELRPDRDEFELYFRQQNDWLLERGIYLEVVRWESFLDAMSPTHMQDEYNARARRADLFVGLFQSKAGKFTEEEFDAAHEAFRESGKPRIFTFFKQAQIAPTPEGLAALTSLLAFQQKLTAHGHFWTSYESTEHLKRLFKDQLEHLQAEGVFDAAPGPARSARASP